MSWSTTLSGTPEKVIKALQDESARMSPGNSKDEFDAALPHLIGLIKLNYGDGLQIIKLNASGHAHSGNYGQCTVSLERLFNVLA